MVFVLVACCVSQLSWAQRVIGGRFSILRPGQITIKLLFYALGIAFDITSFQCGFIVK